MLVLSRRQGEAVRIGDNVIVRVIDVHGDRVRLGIDAPQEVPVHRSEVYEAIKREDAVRKFGPEGGGREIDLPGLARPDRPGKWKREGVTYTVWFDGSAYQASNVLPQFATHGSLCHQRGGWEYLGPEDSETNPPGGFHTGAVDEVFG